MMDGIDRLNFIGHILDELVLLAAKHGVFILPYTSNEDDDIHYHLITSDVFGENQRSDYYKKALYSRKSLEQLRK